MATKEKTKLAPTNGQAKDAPVYTYKQVNEMLKSLSDDLGEKCQFIVAGFRRLYDQIRYHKK